MRAIIGSFLSRHSVLVAALNNHIYLLRGDDEILDSFLGVLAGKVLWN